MHHCLLGTHLKTIFSKVFAALTMLLVLTACSSPLSRITSTPEKNVLTNLPGGNGKVLAVKIDDTPPAHPQYGIASADVVYIEQVEGGLTRLATIFSSKYPETIGPIRSARISDLDILAQYGKVGFAYSGAQSKFRPKIAQANLIDLGAEHEPATIYSRDATRQEPTNMILNAPALLTKAANENKVIDQVKSVGWQFGAAPKVGAQIISAIVKWPASRYKFTWAQSEKRWLISYKDTPDVDASGLQLGAATVIVQLVSITASEYHDKVGGITPFSNTVGTGVGYLLRDGKSFKVNWQRDSAEGGTKFTTETGENANFAPGQIWIALTDQAPKFEVPAPVESASSKSK